MLVSTRFIAPALILMLATSGCADGDPEGDAPPDSDSPTVEEVADLQFMREEEKLARDVYLVLYDEWGLQIFANIAGSEQTHTDAVADMIDLLGLEDPVVDDSVGAFVDPELVHLYADMVAEGLLSSVDALHVGATIEEVDMIDIEDAIERADDPAIIALYESLLCGSRNHLRAFTTQLANAGHPYVVQFLDPAEVEAILTAPREVCATP